MSDHVALLRIPALSLVAGFLSLSAPAFAQLADTPGVVQTSAALDFAGYNCAAVAGEFDSAHTGQVIGGTYREWITLSKIVAGKRTVRCVSEVAPASRQLSSLEAQTLLAASVHGARAPASAAERAASTTGTPDFGAGADAGAKGSLLGEFHDPKSYAVLDGGFGTKQVGNPTSERATAAAADPSLQFPREKPAAIGIDERNKVSSTDASPWNTIGQLVVTWRDGTQSICTGTMISPYAVLTAGQCAHNRRKGGFAAKTSFAPG